MNHLRSTLVFIFSLAFLSGCVGKTDIQNEEDPDPISKPSKDTIAPVITLIGETTITLSIDETYTDEGASAQDDVDGDLSDQIVIVNPVKNAPGSYVVTYNVSDKAGNAAVEVTRKVNIKPKQKCANSRTWKLDFNEAPKPENWKLREGGDFDSTELAEGIWKPKMGRLLDTNPDFDFNQPTSVHLKFRNTSVGGRGAIFWYNVDHTQNEASPIFASLTLQANKTQTLTLFTQDDKGEIELAKYTDLPPSFIDLWLSIDVEKSEVFVWVEGSFSGKYKYAKRTLKGDRFATLTSSGSDAEFDSIEIESCSNPVWTPEIKDTTKPEISLEGGSTLKMKIGENFNDPGAKAFDNFDGDISDKIKTEGTVDVSKAGSYPITYRVSDLAGNQADEKVRTIVVEKKNSALQLVLHASDREPLAPGNTLKALKYCIKNKVEFDGDVILLNGKYVMAHDAGSYAGTTLDQLLTYIKDHAPNTHIKLEIKAFDYNPNRITIRDLVPILKAVKAHDLFDNVMFWTRSMEGVDVMLSELSKLNVPKAHIGVWVHNVKNETNNGKVKALIMDVARSAKETKYKSIDLIGMYNRSSYLDNVRGENAEISLLIAVGSDEKSPNEPALKALKNKGLTHISTFYPESYRKSYLFN